VSDGRAPRQSLLLPILIPVGALLVIGAALWGFSRILLDVSHTAATVTALLVASGIMVIAAVVAGRKESGTPALLSLVGGVLGVAMLTGGGALLLGAPHEEGDGGEPFVVALDIPVDGAVDGYTQTELVAPAAVPFVIHLTSADPVVHNVDIAPGEGEPSLLSSADVLGPDASIDVDVEPLEAGSYYFFCKYHPTTMTGTLTTEEGLEPGGGGGGEALTVRAEGIAFDTDTIELTADTETTITFENADPGTTHNIAFYTDESHETVIWDGPDLIGPGSTEYAVPPIEAGEYVFICDTHPTMAGTLVVKGLEGGGDPPPPGGSGEPPPEGG
jgi:plastocyanin